MKSILYLHGFHSSPMSEKALQFKQHIANYHDDIKVIAPQLPVYPNDAKALLLSIIDEHKASLMGVVGSSLGGFLSTFLHNNFDLPVVVVNPAVRPFELLSDYLGPQVHPITNQAYRLEERHMEALKSMYQDDIRNTDSVWLLQQEGDEVLDYRQALEKYQGCKITFESGGSHAFDDFDQHLSNIVEFLLSKNES